MLYKYIHPQKINRVLQCIRKNISTTIPAPRKKKREENEELRIILPGNCRDIKPPIAIPNCRMAVVVGGANNGYGYTAAEQFLYYGAKKVILADGCNLESGTFACEKLNKAYGKDRAKFYPCDLKNSCQVESIFTSAYCKDEIVSILFHDLDAVKKLPASRLSYCSDAEKISNALRLTEIGLKLMQRREHCSGKKCDNGIIINCAAVLGFMGWPDDPLPVYCTGEPAIETTHDFAKLHPTSETKIRFVALCPANRSIEDIGLPDHPEELNILDEKTCKDKPCSPNPRKDTYRFGLALTHVLASAETGSTWLVEPPYTLRELPRLVNFPIEEGKPAVQPKLINEEKCPVAFYSKFGTPSKQTCDATLCSSDKKAECVKR